MSEERIPLDNGAEVRSVDGGVGPYKIDELIGDGGLALTYRAWDMKNGELVALKEFYPAEFSIRDWATGKIHPRSVEQAEVFEWARKQFMEEARSLSWVHHPGIVEARAPFSANGSVYFAMTFIKGSTMRAWLKEVGSISWEELWPKVDPILSALEFCHQQNMYHFDLTPKNIMLDEEGRPILIDFGNANLAPGEGDESLASRSGFGMFTPGYAPREQRFPSSGRRGPWTDIYSLGAIIYLALSGQTPPEDFSDLTKVERDIRARQPSVPKSVLEAVTQCLETAPSERPQTIAALRDLLPSTTVHGFVAPSMGWRRHRRLAITYGLLSGVLFASTILFLWAGMMT